MMKPGHNFSPAVTNEMAAKASGDCSAVAGRRNPLSSPEDLSKKTRKPYTTTKARESWSEQEHDKFLEALQLFDRDWKKIEAFVGSKSVIQKYFLKVQKTGTSDHIPPPRPKRKAAHPYPQKKSKNVNAVSHGEQFQASAASIEPASMYGLDAPNPVNIHKPPWNCRLVLTVNMSQTVKDKERLSASVVSNSCCYISSSESFPRGGSFSDLDDRIGDSRLIRVTPDFSQVYGFIGSVFDPNSTGHSQRLKQMDPINLETAILLMKNLCLNLTGSEFEKDHSKWLSSYSSNLKKGIPRSEYNVICN